MKPIYCQHMWGDQVAGSDGAFRICKAACHATWLDGRPEPQVQIGQVDEGVDMPPAPYEPPAA